MRIATFNVANLRKERVSSIASQAQPELERLLQESVYTEPTKARILELLTTLGLVRSNDSDLARLRVIRGQLLSRPQQGPVQVLADGRGSWIGWVELRTQSVNEYAMKHTAMVIRDVNADVLGVVESDHRPTLKTVSDALLAEVGGQPYEQVMLIDGNDDRDINVGILARPDYPLLCIHTHVFDTDDEGVVFSRDCCEYHFGTPGGAELTVLVNHFESKGENCAGDPLGAHRRRRQARRVAEICNGLQGSGRDLIAVVGDLNDGSSSTSLKPLLFDTDLRDISNHPGFNADPGTTSPEPEKVNFVLLSPALFARATGGGVFRKGVWHAPRARSWPIYDTLTEPSRAASDHAALYADIDL